MYTSACAVRGNTTQGETMMSNMLEERAAMLREMLATGFGAMKTAEIGSPMPFAVALVMEDGIPNNEATILFTTEDLDIETQAKVVVVSQVGTAADVVEVTSKALWNEIKDVPCTYRVYCAGVTKDGKSFATITSVERGETIAVVTDGRQQSMYAIDQEDGGMRGIVHFDLGRDILYDLGRQTFTCPVCGEDNNDGDGYFCDECKPIMHRVWQERTADYIAAQQEG